MKDYLKMRITKNRLITFFNGLWAIPLALLIILIKPIYHIRLCRIHSERIGHFIFDSIQNIHLLINSPGTILFSVGKNYSNRYWCKMLKRKIFISSSIDYLISWMRYLPSCLLYTSPSPRD